MVCCCLQGVLGHSGMLCKAPRCFSSSVTVPSAVLGHLPEPSAVIWDKVGVGKLGLPQESWGHWEGSSSLLGCQQHIQPLSLAEEAEAHFQPEWQAGSSGSYLENSWEEQLLEQQDHLEKEMEEAKKMISGLQVRDFSSQSGPFQGHPAPHQPVHELG